VKFLCFTAAEKKSRFFPWGAYPAGLKRSGNCPFFKKNLRGLPSAFGYFEKGIESEEKLKVKNMKNKYKNF
jgi:hypothetical protein